MLEIKKLHAKIHEKEILKGINFSLEKGTINVIMGPNGSGKSTLTKAIMGHPLVDIEGSIILNNENITHLKAHERARKGLFLGFQNPVEVSGVNILSFLRTAYNTLNEKKMSILEFKRFALEKAKSISLEEHFLSRSLNEGFSGGEKKKLELLQLLVLDPKVILLDEPDSGLDIDALKEVAKGINSFKSKEKTILIITHYKRILEYIKADKVFIMKEGKIVKEGTMTLVDALEEKGYEGL